MNRLGHANQAARIMDRLAKGPKEGRTSAYDYYLAGLADNSWQRNGQAVAYFHHALRLDPGLWEARIQLQHEGPLDQQQLATLYAVALRMIRTTVVATFLSAIVDSLGFHSI